MKNQYFGDVNDYVKYGLLRCFGDAGLRVGVCWMLTPDDRRGDGGKAGYLHDVERWRTHDPALFDLLHSTVGTGRPRHISIVEDGSIIPRCRFFSETVPVGESARRTWLEAALLALSSIDLLFFDPDNGLEVPSVPYGSKNSSKYLYWSEVRLAWERGVSLLVFQHFPHENRDRYIERIERRLEQEAPSAAVTSLRSPNVLFLLASQRHHSAAGRAAVEMARARWAGPIKPGRSG